MPRVTLLLSGVPQFVTLRDLSYNLDLLFNTDEIETFKIRDLPNHPQTNKRQIALDFRSGYDAMAAQDKLDRYTYELDNGREYTLHAKINKLEEYMCSESMEYEGSRWHGDDWMALAMIPNVSDRDMYKAHARLDAQLQLLSKQKLVLEKEKELLREKQILKRKYGSMGCKSETEVSLPKISRSTSRDRWSSSKPLRSRSRENRARESHRSRSKDSGYVLPQIEWYEKTRELRSQSRERRRSSANSRDRRSSSRDRRSSSRDRRDHRYPRHREQRSRSNDKDKNRRSTSRERGVRARSRSKERLSRSRESRSKEHRIRSRSRERRSQSRERMSCRRSRSRDRTRHDRRGSRLNRDRRGWRLRSPDRRTNRLTIMPQSPRGNSPGGWSLDSFKAAGTPAGNTKHKADISNKQVYKDENKSDNCTKNKDIERKKVDKYNSKIKKAEKTASRVQALSKDIMIIVAIVVDEIMDRDIIRITASNKLTFIKILDDLVQQRLEPIARVKKYDDKEVLTKYKEKYPMEGDLIMMKQMLDEIPKLEMKVPEATVTESTDNAPQIKREPTEAPIIIIDIDSADKAVPRHPQFVVVIKTLLKNMNNVIRTNKLSGEINYTQLKHVLRSILRRMLKGQGFLSREEIVRRFREVYPKENDERFVRNAIKDIKEGKYPVLTGYVIVDSPVPENDGPDEIVLIEKQYDVVTVLDSDDNDDVDKKPIDTSIVTINLDCGSPKAKPNANPSQPTPGPSNVHINTDPVNPDQSNPGSTNSGQDTPCSNTAQTTLRDIPGEAKTSPTDPGQASTGPANTSQANIYTNPCQAKTAAKPGQDMLEPSLVRANTGIPSKAYTGSVSLGQAKTDVPNASQANVGFANLSQALLCSVDAGQAKKGAYNPGQANIDAPTPSKANTGFANLSLAMTRSVDASQAKKGPNNPVQAMPCPVNANKGPNNPSQDKTSLIHPGHAKTVSGNPGQAKKGPNNPVQAMPCPVNANKGPNNPSQDKTSLIHPGHAKTVSGNPGQAKKGPNNGGQAKECLNNPSLAKTCPGNPGQDKSVAGNPGQANAGQAKLGPNNPSKAKTVLGDPGQSKKGSNNAGQANKGPNNSGQIKTASGNLCQAKNDPANIGQTKRTPVNSQVTTGFANPSQAKTCPISSQAALNKENQKRASLDNTSQNLESSYDSDVVVISSPPSGKVARSRKRKKRSLKRKSTGKFQEYPAKGKNNSPEGSKDKVNIDAIEDNDNNLKVTAITILTSLNELIAKSYASEIEVEEPNEIKNEIEIEEDNLDESSLQLPDGPRVTAITIMTSDAELFSLGQEDRKEVDEIKNESDLYYDAEDNLVNDIQRAFDNASFCNSMQSELNEQNNSVNSELFSGVTNSEQFSCKAAGVPQNSRTGQDDEETIESIVKYVASMY